MSFSAAIWSFLSFLGLPLLWSLCRCACPLPCKGKGRIARRKVDDAHSPYRRVDGRFTKHYLFQATTLVELLNCSVKNGAPDKAALGYRPVRNTFPSSSSSSGETSHYDLDDYSWLTVGQVDTLIDTLARAFLSQGITYQERVLLYAGETRPEWFLCVQSLWRIGATVSSLFTSLPPEGIVASIRETQVRHLITSRDLLPGLLPLLHHLPTVGCIYVLEQRGGGLLSGEQVAPAPLIPPNVRLIEYTALLEMKPKVTERQMEERLPKADDIAVLMYTSGSTGTPKGVLLTHRNFLTAVHGVYSSFGASIMLNASRHTYYASLPMAHILGIVSEVCLFAAGFAIGYGSPLTMLDGSAALRPGTPGDLTLLSPTITCAVPLILERMRAKLEARLASSKLKQTVLQLVIRYKTFWQNLGMATPAVNWLFCRKLQATLGGQLQMIIVGGAPLNPQTQHLIENAFNIRVLLGYGATETCGASFLADQDDFSLGTTAPFHGLQYRLHDWKAAGYMATNRPNPRGELLVGGPSIAVGYFKRPQLTAESFEVDTEGVRWFKTGDIVEVFPSGTLRIIDRRKDLHKLENGKYLSLGKVEATLWGFPLLEHVAVFGSLAANYLVALLAVNQRAIQQLAAPDISGAISWEERCQRESIQVEVAEQLRVFCEKAGLAKVETPRFIHLCTSEWSPASGLLTASMKINREAIRAAYKETIEKLFAQEK